MFTVDQRSHIREELIAMARADTAVTGAALVGSAARGDEDSWSDIDLVLQLGEGADEMSTVLNWTRQIDDAHGVADTHDVLAGDIRYRVFLLRSSLQIDISFWPHDRFQASAEGFQLLFGTAIVAPATLPLEAGGMIGRGWLHALHARSALARGRLWQATMMLDGLRDQLVALTCLRHDLDPGHGRGVEQLPVVIREALAHARAERVTAPDIERSKTQMLQLFLSEIELHDCSRASALKEPFKNLLASALPEPLLTHGQDLD